MCPAPMFLPLTHPASFDPRRDTARRRRSALVVCALGAVLVNAGALIASDAVTSSRLAPATKSAISPNRALLLVPPREDAQDAPARAQAFAPPVSESPPVPPKAHGPDAPQAWAKGADVQAPNAQTIRFYRFTEVDRPADPQADWAVEPQALDRLGLERLAFEVLINDRGEIVGCTIIDPPALADDLRNELEGTLRETPMNPAVRNGQRVASVRRIELFLTAEGQ